LLLDLLASGINITAVIDTKLIQIRFFALL